ncbi:MAG: lamin tail domain-containing protein [Saprospiraceae bacterium]
MFKYIAIIGLVLFIMLPMHAQWSQDFDVGDLSDWSGDVETFIINEDLQLQLNGTSSGSSFIFRESILDFDTISIGIKHKMDFAPSNNNRSTIYLALDNEEPSVANGYYIEIGENGGDDALKFHYTENGTSELIATATMGAMAGDPAILNLQINIYPSGLWSVSTSYDGQDLLALDLEFMDNRFSFKSSKYFGLGCKYSASRVDKFFYDDIYIQQFQKDTKPPKVVLVTPKNNRNIDVLFDEIVSMESATNLSNYSLDNGIGNPNAITPLNSQGTGYQLEFNSDFNSNNEYTLTIQNIEDNEGNKLISSTHQFSYAGSPISGDILLSEILFDPLQGGQDFVELYNNSDNNIDLIGCEIRNEQRDESKFITESLVMPPKSYLALSEDIDFLIQQYKPDAGSPIMFQDIPGFNNDEGNVMILTPDGVVLDSFDYFESQHFDLIDDTEGVSLERVSFENDATNINNWHSATKQVRYATPGYANSNTSTVISSNQEFEIVIKAFSPYGNGESNLMIMNYQLEKSGYVANINIHDAAGYLVKKLSQNELLSDRGVVIWDGADSNGTIVDIGIYIIAGKVFHPDGDTKSFKLTTVVADQID